MTTTLNNRKTDENKSYLTNQFILKDNIYLTNLKWFKGSRDRGIR